MSGTQVDRARGRASAESSGRAPRTDRLLVHAGVSGAQGLAILLAAATLSVHSTMLTRPANGIRWGWVVMGIAIASLGWWASRLGAAAVLAYRITMVGLALAGVREWLPAMASSRGLPHLPWLMTGVGVIGLAFTWLPKTAGAIESARLGSDRVEAAAARDDSAAREHWRSSPTANIDTRLG